MFSAFNIDSISITANQEVDLLANLASRLIFAKKFEPDSFMIELLFRPSILDNITNWHVFENDKYIIESLHMEGAFNDVVINEATHQENLRDFCHINKQWSLDELFEMVKSIPKFVVRLEHLYD